MPAPSSPVLPSASTAPQGPDRLERPLIAVFFQTTARLLEPSMVHDKANTAKMNLLFSSNTDRFCHESGVFVPSRANPGVIQLWSLESPKSARARGAKYQLTKGRYSRRMATLAPIFSKDRLRTIAAPSLMPRPPVTRRARFPTTA